MAKEKIADPEDSYRKKLDMCITDAIVKGGKYLITDHITVVIALWIWSRVGLPWFAYRTR